MDSCSQGPNHHHTASKKVRAAAMIAKIDSWYMNSDFFGALRLSGSLVVFRSSTSSSPGSNLAHCLFLTLEAAYS
jgi:hypothetical protein